MYADDKEKTTWCKVPSPMNIGIRSLYHPNSRFLIVHHGVCHGILPGIAVGMFWQDSSFSWDSFAFLITGFFSSEFLDNEPPPDSDNDSVQEYATMTVKYLENT